MVFVTEEIFTVHDFLMFTCFRLSGQKMDVFYGITTQLTEKRK